jgi:hypothetical protein
MPHSTWTDPIDGRMAYTYANFALAKVFFFERWCQWAAERDAAAPQDLSGACKYGSLFMRSVFGGALRGHFQHQYNLIDGRLVDLSHDAHDVGRMSHPYQHEPEYFDIPEQQRSLDGCLPRAEAWAEAFIDQRASAHGLW